MGLEVYGLAARLPAHELYGLTSQLRRAAVSVPANIAEGHARGSAKDFANFLSIANGSLAEVDTLLEFALRLDYITPQEVGQLSEKISATGKMLTNLRRSVLRPAG